MFSYGKVVLSLAMLSSACFGMQVMRNGAEFKVLDGDSTHPVQNCFKSKFLRGLTEVQLAKFEQAGNRFKAIKMSNKEYGVQEEGGLKGGGPFLTALAVTGTLVVGGVATLGAAAGGFVVGGPAGAGVAAVLTAKATCAAAVYVAIATSVAPTP